MARVLEPAMNMINSDLKFTTESQEDYENERLPTLDFEMWLEPDGIKHSYYQKPMKTPLVLMERSAMAFQQKIQILTNELNRRLSNILIDEIPKSEINIKIEQYIQELKSSGYSHSQTKEIIVSRIRGWKNRIRKRKRENKQFYRPAESTLEERMEKEITAKENWYKQKDDDDEDDDQESPKKYVRNNDRLRAIPSPSKRLPPRSRRMMAKFNKDKVTSVMFVPHTVNSSLAKTLQEKEIKLKEITGDKIKIVERSGNKLEDLLTRNNPWKGKDCGRPNCLLCTTKTITGKNLSQDCSKRNILYEIKCLTCEKKIMEEIEAATEDEEKRKELKECANIPTYIGESSRSAYERGFEHLEKLTSLNSKSQMLRHVVDKHENENVEKVQWGMRIIKYMKSAFERQIEEAVTIERKAKEGEILNSKCEYNQTTLPRLITRIGDREAEIKEFEKEIRKEKEYEEKMEEKIRIMRKDRNKERLRTEKNT